MNALTQTTNEPAQKFTSLDDIINALPVAERRAINKESKRIARRMKRATDEKLLQLAQRLREGAK